MKPLLLRTDMSDEQRIAARMLALCCDTGAVLHEMADALMDLHSREPDEYAARTLMHDAEVLEDAAALTELVRDDEEARAKLTDVACRMLAERMTEMACAGVEEEP